MPEFVIGEGRFAARDRMSPWAMMKLAKNQQRSAAGDVMAGMAGMHDFLMSTVQAEERTRLAEFLDEHDFQMDELNEAIGALMTEYTDRPTERPSASPSGAPTTGPRSRVVSLSRGTVREDEASSEDGASAAS